MVRRRLTQKQVVVGIAVGVGLLHFLVGPSYRGPLRAFVNGYLIDLLLPFAMYLLLGVATRPFALPRAARAAIVLAVGVTVEMLQFRGVPIFGRTFDPWDFLMYLLGVAGAFLFERTVLSRVRVREGAALGAQASERLSN
jgi:hypothetical protein